MDVFTPEEEYRQLLKEGKMTYEEIQAVLEGKKSEVVQEVIERRFLLSGKGLDSQSDSGYNGDTQNLGGVNDGDTGRNAEVVRELDFDSKGVSERASERRNISDGRRDSGNSYQNNKQQIRYNELSAYEKSRVNEILYTPIDESGRLDAPMKNVLLLDIPKKR